jgi:hypothetical protein
MRDFLEKALYADLATIPFVNMTLLGKSTHHMKEKIKLKDLDSQDFEKGLVWPKGVNL